MSTSSHPARPAALDGVEFAFLTPRKLPKPETLRGRVAVLDIAFASDGGGASYETVTLPFIEGLGSRLAAWVDHHDHERHADYQADRRFTLSTKAEHGACPEMVTPDIVAAAGPVDTVAVHVDLDGIYAGAKWLLKGEEPYEGADADARAVDTRTGTPGPIADCIDRALRVEFRDENLKHRIIQYLLARTKAPHHWAEIVAIADRYEPLLEETRRIAAQYKVDSGVAYVRPDTGKRGKKYDKTELLLMGQRLAAVAVVHDSGSLSIAADFESGLDFVKLFDIKGGMPTRVSVPEARLDEVMTKIADAVAALQKGAAPKVP